MTHFHLTKKTGASRHCDAKCSGCSTTDANQDLGRIEYDEYGLEHRQCYMFLHHISSYFIMDRDWMKQPPATTGNQGTQRTKQSDESGPGSIVHEITTKKFQSSVQRCSWHSVNRSVICFRRHKVMVCHGFLCVLPKQ